MTAVVERPTAQGRRLVLLRSGLGLLAATQAGIGAWALLAPRAFYNGFPAAGHAWVALLPPYNEHLVRDVGALSLAITMMVVVAAVTADRRVSATALAAYAVYAVPHTLFHGLHLDGFSVEDAAAQMGGFVFQLVLIAATGWPLWHHRTPSSTKDRPEGASG